VKPRSFLLFDPMNRPLQHRSGLFEIPEGELPEAIHAWLDSAAPMEGSEPVADRPVARPVQAVAEVDLNKPVRGLQNDQNKCYWNSLVQMMRSIPEVRNAILGFDAEAFKDIAVPNGAFPKKVFESMIAELQSLFRAIGSAGNPYSALPHYKKLLDVLFPRLPYSKQHSLDEVLQRLFLNVMEYLLPTSPFLFRQTIKKACLLPSPPRTPTTDPASSIPLPLGKDIQTSLELFMAEERVEEAANYLKGCKSAEGGDSGPYSKSISVQIPKENQYVLLSLNKMVYNMETETTQYVKKTVGTSKTIQLDGVTFQLRGVVLYAGDGEEGHYMYAHCKGGNPVLLANDSSIAASAGLNDLVASNGLLYLYERVLSEVKEEKEEKAEEKPKEGKPKKAKECPEGEVLNPKTNRCVDAKGPIGKKLLKEAKA
jgi:hypothetical protein